MSEFSASGACLCGKVTYRINGEPVRMGQCHCKDCQRASGAGHASIAFFMEDQIEIDGEPSSFDVTADSGNVNTRHFCPDCGSRLFGTNSARAGVRGVMLGSFDDNSWFEPQMVVYCKDRQSWDNTSTEVPNFDAMPPAPK